MRLGILNWVISQGKESGWMLRHHYRRSRGSVIMITCDQNPSLSSRIFSTYRICITIVPRKTKIECKGVYKSQKREEKRGKKKVNIGISIIQSSRKNREKKRKWK